MSTFGGFGGFGQSNNQTSGAFGATNTNNATSGGFGTGFGSTPAANPFGGGGGTTGGFGSGGSGGFGQTQTSSAPSLFGANKPAFGATAAPTGTGLFGAAATSSGGGFGNNTATANTGFGNTSNSAFSFGGGQNKTAFGSNSGIFGSANTATASPFGQQVAPFGQAASGTALNQVVPPSEGTAVLPYSATNEKDPTGAGTNNFQSINFMPAYSKYSFEEMRLADYDRGRKYGNNSGQAGAFGGGGFGAAAGNTGFGQNNAQPTTQSNPFGSQSLSGATAFGGTSTGFGGGTNNAFGARPATGMFGAQTSAATTGGLFGTSSAPTGFGAGGFGATAAATPFGGNQAPKPSLFGNTGGTGMFGAATSQPAQTGGLFGAATTNEPAKAGGLFGGGGFGAQTSQAPATGLFGAPAAPNPFGVSQGAQQSGFGATATNAGGGLFGAANTTQQKPMFGGTGGFGAAPSGGTGLFGANTASQPQGGLFGGAQANPSGGLFGAAQQKPSLFSNAQPAAAPSFFSAQPNNGGFGQSQPQPQQAQQPGSLQASLLDGNPYGQASIWSGLPEATPQNSGPLVTPLSASQRLKESQRKAMPVFRSSASRMMTPGRRLGLSYSNYNSPSSVASTPTGSSFGGSMYGRSFTGGSFGRAVGKSVSANNLRQQFNSDSDSVLLPGAFAPGSSRYSSGSIRRLTIDRNMKADLFAASTPPQLRLAAEPTQNGATPTEEPASEQGEKPKKKVSFSSDDNPIVPGEPKTSVNGASNSQNSEEAASSSPRKNASSGPVRGNELAVVPENQEAAPQLRKDPAEHDPVPGEYWMNPSRAVISKMARQEAQHFTGFQVGRKDCGTVTFNGEVDLTSLPLDALYGEENIVQIETRYILVYPPTSKVAKPEMGKGLNVPSTLTLENAWPRRHGQPTSDVNPRLYRRHIEYLKKVPGTTFVHYEPTTGVWTFTVPHYTRYGLDYDDYDEESGVGERVESGSEGGMEIDNSSPTQAGMTLPGDFDGEFGAQYGNVNDTSESERSFDSESSDVEMAGSFPRPDQPVQTPVKPSVLAKSNAWDTPGPLIDLDGDWADQLQRTISPRKQNRDLLRSMQKTVPVHRGLSQVKQTQPEFRNNIDLMNSLFGQHEEKMALRRSQDKNAKVEFPFPARAKPFDAQGELSSMDQQWHAAFPIKWTASGSLMWASRKRSKKVDASWYDLRVLKVGKTNLMISSLKDSQMGDPSSILQNVKISLVGGVPFARQKPVRFSGLAEQVAQRGQETGTAGARQELAIYELCHVLFDKYDDDFSEGLTAAQKMKYADRIQRDRLSDFWASMVVGSRSQSQAASEESVVGLLSAHQVPEACKQLVTSGNARLATIIAQLDDASPEFQSDMEDQLKAWRDQNTISEISEPIRALYEIAAGNTSVATGSRSDQSMENRARTFSIAQRFDLDWTQAFGLWLWYGKNRTRPIGEIILAFEKMLSSQPVTPYLNDQKDANPLWTMLLIFAGSKSNGPLLPQALSPLNQPFNAQVSFSLYHALLSALPDLNHSTDAADSLALSLSAQYSAISPASTDTLITALLPLLYLSSPDTRRTSIQTLLSTHAPLLTTPDSTLTAFLSTTKIPPAYISHALAQLYHSQHQPLQHLTALLAAGDHEAAHTVFCQRVAPRAVIDQDWSVLAEILHGEPGKQLKKHVTTAAWEKGGGVFEAFLELVAPGSAKETALHGAKGQRERVFRLAAVLVNQNSDVSSAQDRNIGGGGGGGDADRQVHTDAPALDLEQQIARSEMARCVAGIIADMQADSSTSNPPPEIDVLALPLTADARVVHARQKALKVYQGIMGAA